ncbi:MAG: hypothetical protein PHD10_01955 [Bacilli bacterium]|nr:hypothetical protein [Bacilli bacterium]MDD4607887.1 hypothetical protein [Bacilli bacterium]
MNVLKKIPLKNSINNQYVNCVYANNNYYFLVPSLDLVFKYDMFLDNFENYVTEKKYISITYNKIDNLFYLIRENDINNIYVADLEFKEVGLIKLNISEKYRQNINDIYYNEKKKRIYITTNDYVYSVTEDGYFIKEEYDITKVGTKTTTTMVKELDGSCYPITTVVPIPNTYFTCCFSFGNSLWISYVREDSSYLIRLSSKGSLIESNYIDSDIKINSIISINDCINLLILSDDVYNYIYITDVNYYNKEQQCEHIIDGIKIEQCEDCCSNILSSIASIALELSNILMTEGKKLNKIVKETTNSNEILEVSNSVNKTIDKITELEQLLIDKIESVSEGK